MRRALNSLANNRKLLLKSSFFTNDVFIPSHLCNFKSSDAGGRLSRYVFQFDKIRSISARCFELIRKAHSPITIQKKMPPLHGHETNAWPVQNKYMVIGWILVEKPDCYKNRLLPVVVSSPEVRSSSLYMEST